MTSQMPENSRDTPTSPLESDSMENSSFQQRFQIPLAAWEGTKR